MEEQPTPAGVTELIASLDVLQRNTQPTDPQQPFQVKYTARAELQRWLSALQQDTDNGTNAAAVTAEQPTTNQTGQNAATNANGVQESKHAAGGTGQQVENKQQQQQPSDTQTQQCIAVQARAQPPSRRQIAIGRLELQLGANFVDCEEWGVGEKFLVRGIEHLRGTLGTAKQDSGNATEPVHEDCGREGLHAEIVAGYNALGILWSNRGEMEKARTCLLLAMHVYQQHDKATKEDSDSGITAVDEKGASDGRRGVKAIDSPIEKQHTLTLYYLAQVFGALNKTVLSAHFVRATIQRQLLARNVDVMRQDDVFQPIETARNLIGLAAYYRGVAWLTHARYCLEAAKHFLPKGVVPVPKADDGSVPSSMRELGGDYARGMGALYLRWLALSRRAFIAKQQALGVEIDDVGDTEEQEHAEEASADMVRAALGLTKKQTTSSTRDGDNAAAAVAGTAVPATLNLCCSESEIQSVAHKVEFDIKSLCSRGEAAVPISFDSLPEVSVPAKVELATTRAAAIPIFKGGLKQFAQATHVFVLDGFVSDHIHVVQDMSQLYRFLITFEKDKSNQCKLLKRRVDMLEPIVSQLSSKMYLELYQQLTDELARVYQSLSNTKSDIMRASTASREVVVKKMVKINVLTLKAIKNYDLWLDAWKGIKGRAPVKGELDKEYHRPYFTALFCRARLWGRMISPDPKEQSFFIQKSLALYHELVSWCDEHEVDKVEFEKELHIVREMVQLLPGKLHMIGKKGSAFNEYY